MLGFLQGLSHRGRGGAGRGGAGRGGAGRGGVELVIGEANKWY